MAAAEDAPAPRSSPPHARGIVAGARVLLQSLPPAFPLGSKARVAFVHRGSLITSLASFSATQQHNSLARDQVLDLFGNCIKLSFEIKINQKKMWEVGFRDHLIEIIQAGEDDDGTNFQKVSCALKTGVKIYSLLVDSIQLEAYKVLGRMNHSGRGKEDDDPGDNNDDFISSGPCDDDDFYGYPVEKNSLRKLPSLNYLTCQVQNILDWCVMRVSDVWLSFVEQFTKHRADQGFIIKKRTLVTLHHKLHCGNLISDLEAGANGEPSQDKDIRKKISPALTLESSFQALTAKKFDEDSLHCQTISQFDEDGVKGLMLNSLGVYGNCRVLFDSFEVSDKCILSDMQEKYEEVDLSSARDDPGDNNDLILYATCDDDKFCGYHVDENLRKELSSLTYLSCNDKFNCKLNLKFIDTLHRHHKQHLIDHFQDINMTQVALDMYCIQVRTKRMELERLMNDIASLGDALKKARNHVIAPGKTPSAKFFLHGFLLLVHNSYEALLEKESTAVNKKDEREQISIKLKEEQLAKGHEIMWLHDFQRSEKEQLRPDTGERGKKPPLLDQLHSQTSLYNMHQSDITVQKTRMALIHVDHMDGRFYILVDTNQSCKSFKKLIENRLGCSLKNITLRYKSKLLDNGMSLHSKGLSHNSRVDLYPKLLGECESDMSLDDFTKRGIPFTSIICMPDPYVGNSSMNVENLNVEGRRLAKSIVDSFVEQHRKNQTWNGRLELKDFKVYNGRAEIKKHANGGWTFEAWKNDCKTLAKILKQLFTSRPLYLKDLINNLEAVKRTEMNLEWFRTYIQNHFAFAPSYNRSNVSCKMVQLYDGMPPRDQRKFRSDINGLRYTCWSSNKVRHAYIFQDTFTYRSKMGRSYDLTCFGCFKFQRNFCVHASEEKVNGVAKFPWDHLEYIIPVVLKNFVPLVIRELLEKGYDLVELLQSAVPY